MKRRKKMKPNKTKGKQSIKNRKRDNIDIRWSLKKAT